MDRNEIPRILRAYKDAGVYASQGMFSDGISVRMEAEHQIDHVIDIGHVQSICFPGRSWVARDLPKAFRLSGLESLTVNAHRIRGSVFEGISQLENLKKLFIGELLLDADLAMEHVAQCSRLEEITFHDSLVSPDGYAFLSRLTRLRYLEFHRCTLGELGWETIGKLSSLCRLWVTFADLPYRPFDSITSLSNLEELSLSMSIIGGDPGFSSLATLSKLTNLDLEGTYIEDDRIDGLSLLTQLRKLNLSETRISRKGLKSLRKRLPECEIEYSFAPIPDTSEYFPPLKKTALSVELRQPNR